MTAFRESPWSAVLVMLLGVMATLAIPKWVDDFALIQITIYLVMDIGYQPSFYLGLLRHFVFWPSVVFWLRCLHLCFIGHQHG